MSIKVLVADDSITIQKVIGIIFGGDEYSLTIVDNGKSALDTAREINPDILLIDALMPGMTGYEVAEMVRATPSLAAKPILLLTGSFEPFDEDKAKRCGADDFIAKPFESQQIIAKVQELLTLGNSRGSAAAANIAPPATAPSADQGAPPAVSGTDIPMPAYTVQPEAPQPVTPADIWGAFTPEIEMAPPAVPFELPATPAFQPFEPDVFAIVSEERAADQALSAAVSAAPPPLADAQWIPVEESTFDFAEDPAEGAASPSQPPPLPLAEASFGDIVFDDEPADQNASVRGAAEPVTAVSIQEPVDFEPPLSTFATAAAPPDPFTPLPDCKPAVLAAMDQSPVDCTADTAPALSAAPAALQLTEEQLRSALASVSQEVIERIVWEIVPDLAEAMIREAIRKIKDGD